MDWIVVAQNRNMWLAVIKMVMKSKCEEFLRNCQLLKREFTP